MNVPRIPGTARPDIALRATQRDGQWMARCPDPACDYANASGIQVHKHVQRVHLSKNEPGSAPWWKGGAVTDVLGRMERNWATGKAYPRKVA